MAHHQENIPVVKNYTGTAVLSFCIMFFLFVSLSYCHGPFHPVSSHHAASHQEHKGATEHKATEEHHGAEECHH